jgi:hypothetical protein
MVQYESQLELEFLFLLEESADIVRYREQPFAVSFEHKGVKRWYFPDVFFVLECGRGTVVEVKPIFQMALKENLVKWSALRRFCADRGLGILVTDGRYAIQQVQQRDIRPEFAQAILKGLQRGPLTWPRYREIRDEYSVSRNEFLALVLRKRLIWELNPFRLSLDDES